jgi:hypothetical protein
VGPQQLGDVFHRAGHRGGFLAGMDRVHPVPLEAGDPADRGQAWLRRRRADPAVRAARESLESLLAGLICPRRSVIGNELAFALDTKDTFL